MNDISPVASLPTTPKTPVKKTPKAKVSVVAQEETAKTSVVSTVDPTPILEQSEQAVVLPAPTAQEQLSEPTQAPQIASQSQQSPREFISARAGALQQQTTQNGKSVRTRPQNGQAQQPQQSGNLATLMSKNIPVVPLRRSAPEKIEKKENTAIVTGYLDNSRDGHGVVRVSLIGEDDMDAYIATSQLRRLRLKSGDIISGPAREPKENERFWGMLKVDTVNGMPVEQFREINRVNFQKLTPVYPDSQIKLETGAEPLDLRIIDMIAPIGKGQRSLIVSPPKAGKTTLLKNISSGVATNHPEIHIMAVLVGERPEEVTDIRRHIDRITNGKGEVAASNFDEPATDQCRIAELALERAKRLVEEGKDVIVLLDSITRLARAYNLAIPTSGRTLSGGFDPAALFPPKKFFGAARNFEVPGSLTIVGTALVETGSRMDDLVYEEFKGTGNQEVHLDRKLAERRIYPAIDVQRSGTRRDDLLIGAMDYLSISTLHRMLDMIDKEQRTQTLIDQLKKSKSNREFLSSLKNG